MGRVVSPVTPVTLAPLHLPESNLAGHRQAACDKVRVEWSSDISEFAQVMRVAGLHVTMRTTRICDQLEAVGSTLETKVKGCSEAVSHTRIQTAVSADMLATKGRQMAGQGR
ncbi:hypothetical protein C0Q70_15949 [Pomacea canaliculata]|uniref:Uncharacterized protein n=1 Tax=Pomacea canaliculata TaxID=400727 RepID=A0A2T7NNG0_POMCA|nr:hypothetical protein C0Q70_15949 [Pomacea canaliculata]